MMQKSEKVHSFGFEATNQGIISQVNHVLVFTLSAMA